MSLELVIETGLFERRKALAFEEYRDVLSLQESAIKNKFSRHEAIKAAEAINNNSAFFIGAYNSLKQKALSNGFFPLAVDDGFKRSYFAFAACEATLQNIDVNSSIPFLRGNGIGLEDIDFSFDDRYILTSIVEGLTTRAKNVFDASEISPACAEYFSILKDEAARSLKSYSRSGFEEVKNASVKSKYFSINKDSFEKKPEIVIKKQGLKDNNGGNGSIDIHDVHPEILPLNQLVSEEDILGNDEAKTAAALSVRQLMAYDKEMGLNPFIEDGGFRNLLLFYGEPGNGKTMVAKYAASEGKRIAERTGLDFEAVELLVDDSYQAGPVLKLKSQLKKISEDSKPYLIFIDEMETKFPDVAFTSKNSDYKNDLVRGLLEFTDGLSYHNKGNYVVIGATNIPDHVDRRIRSRFRDGSFECGGPESAEQKARVLYNNLKVGIDNGYVNIADWTNIGGVAFELGLSGRDLKKTAKNVLEKSRIHDYGDIFFVNSYSDKSAYIKKNHSLIKEDDLLREMYVIGSSEKSVKTSTERFLS